MLRPLLAAVAAALVLIAPATATTLSAKKQSRLSLLGVMNSVRAQHGLARLTLDPRLGRAARAHSREMIGSNVFEHGAFATRMLHFNVAGRIAGENLAWGTGARGTALGIVRAWLASPEHRANLLRPSFSRVGIADVLGTFQGFHGAHVVTADFAG
jgi:uncharacterized protein YkwD